MKSANILEKINSTIKTNYLADRNVLDFNSFLKLVADNPERYTRNVAHYTMDAMEHYGTEELKRPYGVANRFRLFDLPFDDGEEHLVGQEEVQLAFHRILTNFIQQGKIDRLILFHGPNGSSKSTFITCLLRGLEHYSTTPDGTLYRFSWVFPSSAKRGSGIGFMDTGAGAAEDASSFAHLGDDHVEAHIPCELADNPLFLLPVQEREDFLASILEGKPLAGDETKKEGERAARYAESVRRGDLCHKCRRIFDALLHAYKGDYRKVMRHVRVERHFLSRRYRRGAVTVEPQLRVDAGTRQITFNRSLNSLPPALQNITLFEPYGDLIDANRGILEYNDLLKRPIDSFKYLLSTGEKATVSLDNVLVFLDCLFLGSTNEKHLAAFKELPDFATYKGRIELVRVPYLRDYLEESRIYTSQVKGNLRVHVAPHTIELAAQWAVMSRLRRVSNQELSGRVREIAGRLSPMEKVELYATGEVPDDFSPQDSRDLRSSIEQLWHETDGHNEPEGMVGASPREIKTVLMNGAQTAGRECLTPLLLLDGLEELIRQTSVYDFLKQEPRGEYLNPRGHTDAVRLKYIDRIENDVRRASGLVEETMYVDLFSRYVENVNSSIRGDKRRDPLTGRALDPDESLMNKVEKALDVGDDKDDFREHLIGRIAVAGIEKPGQRLDYGELFPNYLKRLHAAYCNEHTEKLRPLLRDGLKLLDPQSYDYRDEGAPVANLEEEERSRKMVESLIQMGYCRHCIGEALSILLKTRYR